ncbi:hypothetical protein [Candidatus Poriferisodalis sp.]|uniref:hypothetical protein n=1 Tax=Candidatus Poriferisodalis sp. TaxID=3101277 RepID=UPI003B02A138
MENAASTQGPSCPRAALRTIIVELKVASIALSPLGCGNGGLNWADVRPLIEDKLQGLETEVHIYAPAGAPAATDMRVATPRRA